MRAANVDAKVVFVGNDKPLAERLTQAEVPFIALAFDRGRSALWHPRVFASAVGRAGADGVVLPASDFLAPALRLGGYRGRIVAVEHGSLLQTNPVHRRPALVERLDSLAGNLFVDVHVAVSAFLRDRMRSGPVVTIPNGVDLELYRPTTAPGTNEGFVIGCVSRLIPGKGVEDVLASAKLTLARGARLRIAGDGPDRGVLEQQAEQLGIGESVSFEGWLGGADDIAQFWNECDVAIAAPNEWVESFGLGAVEAMACGRPVVATRVGGLSDAVVDGRTGFLVEARDTDALADRLFAYADDRGLLAVHGAAARERAAERFDIERCAAEYTRLFGSNSS
jgi:glycosyltransferase involved in cell wall biosynthesis